MTEIKLTKKELQAKIESLEKELYLYKNRTQLARNYVILQKEYEDQRVKFYKKRKEMKIERKGEKRKGKKEMKERNR